MTENRLGDGDTHLDRGDVNRDTMCARIVAAGEQDENRVNGASAAHAGLRWWKTLAQELDMEMVTARTKRVLQTVQDKLALPTQTCTNVVVLLGKPNSTGERPITLAGCLCAVFAAPEGSA